MITETDLYVAMDSEKAVRVICTDGTEFSGRCWAYGAQVSEEEFGYSEPCLDIAGTVLKLSEIVKIEYKD